MPAGAAAAGADPTAAPPNVRALVLRVQAAMLAQDSLAAAATAGCGALAEAIGARRACIGIDRDGHCVPVAVSGGNVEDLDRGELDALSAAMDEALDQHATVSSPPTATECRIARAADTLRRRHGALVLVLPLMHGEQPVGALTIERMPDAVDRVALASACEDVAAMVGPVIGLLERSEMPLVRRLRMSVGGTLEAFRAPERRKTRWAVGAAAAFLLLLGLVPLPYSVGAPARVEGAVQRTVAAPANGFLKTVLVRPGDPVREGQVLVELADRDLGLERSKSTSEIAQHENAYAAAMAKADRATMMIHGAKLGEARAQLQLVEQQLGRTRLESPIDGVVIQGDLTQSLGAPVERGQVLMTVAPREQFRVIVELDERDVAAVEVGQQGRLALSALPWDALPIRIVRVTPMATVVDGRNVFELEARLDAASTVLRPGLRGVSRIDVGRGPLLLVWTRRITDHLARLFWRWLP